MSNPEHINMAGRRTTTGDDKGGSREAPLTDVMEEGIAFQILQRLGRIENQLAAIENRLAGAKVKGTVTVEKTKLRNQLIALLMKGWTSEVDVIAFTGREGRAPWQTIGVRSFVTKLRTLGLVVEEDEREGVKYFRIAK